MNPLTIKREHDVIQFVLDRPRKRNALSPELVEALTDAMLAVRDEDTCLVVIRGSGTAFCAGFDFSDVSGQSDGDIALRLLRVEQLLQTIHHLPVPTLALAQGPCFGAGADIFAACSMRIAAPGATFRMPGLRFGVVLGTRRLAEIVGGDEAFGLLHASRVFDADEALRTGFARDIRPEAEWAATIDDAAIAMRVLSAQARRALLERTRTDTRDADMAALARSVAVPGLRDRIIGFISESSK